MSLHTQIKGEVQNALKARDEVRLRTLRGLLAAFTNELVATKQKPGSVLSDKVVTEVISKDAKKRKDSFEQFIKGKRDDLAESEKLELAILETYLPDMMDRKAVESVVTTKQKELKITDVTQKGKLMGAVMQELKGKADGTLVKEVVDALLD